MAKGARKEGIIPLESREVRVLYTNAAIGEIEGQLGKTIQTILEGFSNGNSGMVEVVHILRSGMEAARRDSREGGRVVTLKDAYDVMDEAGFTQVVEVTIVAVAGVLSYSAEDGEPEDPNP
jgi:hypothetical protein